MTYAAAPGAIRPSFQPDDSAWLATDIVVVTEGKKIDGVVQVIETLVDVSLRKEIGDVTSEQTALNAAAAIVNPSDGAEALRPFIHSSTYLAQQTAFIKLTECGLGVRTFFSRNKDWELLTVTRNPTASILERCIFTHRRTSVLLVADAYRGKEISQTTCDFLEAAGGKPGEKLKIGNVEFHTGGSADRLVKASLVAQGHQRIDTRGASRGNQTRN